MNVIMNISVAIACYLMYPKQLRINPSRLYALTLIHNSLLVAFSAWTFCSLAQIVYKERQISNYFKNKQFDIFIYRFYISKYYEFVDTFILYLNNKSPIFLQKYHHIGALICWHLCYVHKVEGIWIATLLNSFVHTIMYSYYLGCLLKIKHVRFIKKYITSLQLCQLIPQPICLYLYNDNYNILLFFTAYSVGLVILFGQFYYHNYMIYK